MAEENAKNDKLNIFNLKPDLIPFQVRVGDLTIYGTFDRNKVKVRHTIYGTEMDAMQAGIDMLAECIDDWNINLPISRESVLQLPMCVFTKIFESVAAFNNGTSKPDIKGL